MLQTYIYRRLQAQERDVYGRVSHWPLLAAPVSKGGLDSNSIAEVSSGVHLLGRPRNPVADARPEKAKPNRSGRMNNPEAGVSLVGPSASSPGDCCRSTSSSDLLAIISIALALSRGVALENAC